MLKSLYMRLKQAANVRVAALSTACMAVATFVVAGDAMAVGEPTTYDFAPAADGVTPQITSVLTVVLPLAGSLLALTLGWRLLRKFVKA
jgi:hypothetical protein